MEQVLWMLHAEVGHDMQLRTEQEKKKKEKKPTSFNVCTENCKHVKN